MQKGGAKTFKPGELMEKWLEFGAWALALVAAVFWFLSASGNLPPMVSYLGPSNPPDDPFYQSVKFSAEMNTWGALFSGASALCMGVKGFIGFYRCPARSEARSCSQSCGDESTP